MSERPLPLGTNTRWGKVGAVMLTGGERYYQIVGPGGAVALMPADVVKPTAEKPTP